MTIHVHPEPPSPFAPPPGRRLVWVALFYVVFAAFYFVAIRLSSPDPYGDYYTWQVFIDYGLKALYTLPIWWVLFRSRVAEWPLPRKLLLHLLFAPLYVGAWQKTYYFICDNLGLGRLVGHGEWWDLYIPTLFYGVQFGIFHAYVYYRNLTAALAREAQLREAALSSELTALKAQLNPHFLYNTFNTISASVPPAQEHTRELIAGLSDLFRYQLRASRLEWVRLAEEVSFVRQYLALEQARFGERLRVQIDAAPEAEAALVPPMLLQPLLENAVRHGISPKVDGGTVSLEVRRQGDRLHFVVADTGVGTTVARLREATGIGLTNTRRRLQLLYQTELQITANEPGGLRLAFTIPYHHAAESSNHRRRSAGPAVAAGVPQ